MTKQDDAGVTDPDIMAIRTLLVEQVDGNGVGDPTPTAPGKPERRHARDTVSDVRVPTDHAKAHEDELRSQIRAAKAEADLTQQKEELRARGQAGAVRGGRVAAVMSPVLNRLPGYRPNRRHVALAGVVVLALWCPWLLMTMVVLPLLVVAGIFVAVGHDRFWAGVLRGYKRLHARNPARAERLRARADRFALRWDAVLDRFPEGTVDALYLPDLNSLQEAQAQHAQALDRRFQRLQQDAGTQ